MADHKKLARERKRLAAILPILDADRRSDVELRLKHLDALLGRRPKAGVGTLPEQAAGIDGVGSLRFQARTVPGEGRLVRLPLILRAFDANQAPDIVVPAPPDGPPLPVGPKIITDAGTNVPANNSATVIATVPTATGVNVLKSMFFQTDVLEWVKYRVVGFQASSMAAPQYTVTPGMLPLAPGVDYTSASYYVIPSPVPFLLVRNLNVGGSANLFPHNGFIDAAYYNGTLPYFTGLRDYPVVDRTNRVAVEAAVSGAQASSLTFALWVVGEVLTDTMYGDPQPGPYVQEGAVKRAPSKRKEGFVR